MSAPTVGQLNLGEYLKIVSKGAVYNKLSEDSAIWDMVKKQKKGPQEGRELRFLLRSAYGAPAAGFVAVDGGSYPGSSQAKIKEGTAQYKDFALTVEVERTLIEKAVSDFSRYGEPLAEELRSKTIVLSRLLSGAAYRDGTGRIGTVKSATAPTGTAPGATMEVTLETDHRAPSHIGWFEQGDYVRFRKRTAAESDASNATAPAFVEQGTSATGFSADEAIWEVTDRDRDNDKVTFELISGTADTVAPAAKEYIYRAIQKTIPKFLGDFDSATPDLDPAFSSDYNGASQSWTGLEALSFDQGQTVNGIPMTGTLKGTRKSANGNPIDSRHFQRIMSQIMIAVGQGRYKYSRALQAWETYDTLVESREVDRRFQNIKDNKRGVESLGYQHTKHSLIFEPDEFCPKQRIFICPDADVIQFYGSDFDFVKPDGNQKFMLKPNNQGGHDRAVRAYMEGEGSMLSVHSPAIGVLYDFVAA